MGKRKTFAPLFKRIFISLSIACFFHPQARGDEIYTFVVKKQEQKAKTRWSLSEWLETRDRIRLMDLWLALHSPSPYEFFIDGAFRRTTVRDGSPKSGGFVAAGAYASIFGLEAQRDPSVNDRTLGLFNLRIFGFHAQGTNITLRLGVEQQKIQGALTRSLVWGASSSLYLNRFIGVDALYLHAGDSTPNGSQFILSNHRWEFTAFIDFKFLRVYGNYFTESESWNSPARQFELMKTGFSAGARFFF